MVGVLPIGTTPGATPQQAAFFWSLRGAQLETWRQRGLDAWKDDAAASLAVDRTAAGPDRDASAPHLRRLRPSHHRDALRAGTDPYRRRLACGEPATRPGRQHGLARCLRTCQGPARDRCRCARRSPRDCAAPTARPHLSGDERAVHAGLSIRQSHAAAAARPYRRPADAALAGNTPARRDGRRPDRLAASTSLGLARTAQAPHTTGFSNIAGRDPLIVFDGECVLCSTQAQFVLRHDRIKRFRLTTAQGGDRPRAVSAAGIADRRLSHHAADRGRPGADAL